MYYPTYREPVESSEDIAQQVNLLNEDDSPQTLENIRSLCQEIGCNAALYDAAGFAQGWVHADGTYTVQTP
jgi:hypothetical protein